MDYHLYADDTQLYVSFETKDLAITLAKVEACIADIRRWMCSNFLCLNDSKTEILVIGKKASLKDIPEFSLKIGNDSILPNSSARNIGAVFDKSLTMCDQISAISKGAWYHLKQIGTIRPYLDQESAKALVHSLVSSRLDSFNSLLYGVPKYELMRLQRIQNAAARMITGLKKHEHITPTLINLHWLPIQYRIDYKILVLVYKCLHELAPAYLSDLIKVRRTERSLRNNNIPSLIVPKKECVTYGENSFSFAGPFLWNLLPIDCKSSGSLNVFKRRLKTHIFRQAYNL